jgi:hypothetical protein
LYFPPLFLGISGDITASGTGFGLFAKEDIESNCFIGEYAADILTEAYSIQIKRCDSIMGLIDGDRPNKKVVIGPAIRCGYVCLINGASKQQSNCNRIKV